MLSSTFLNFDMRCSPAQRHLQPCHQTQAIRRSRSRFFSQGGARRTGICFKCSGRRAHRSTPPGKTDRRSKLVSPMQRLGDKPRLKEEGMLAPLAARPHLPTRTGLGAAAPDAATSATSAQNGTTSPTQQLLLLKALLPVFLSSSGSRTRRRHEP